jgi:HPr kinase/phosphorylase
MIRMPVAPGRNVAILVEVAARNQLLKTRGHHAARRLVDRLNQQLMADQTVGDPEQDHGEDL